MNRNEWYEKTSEIIANDLESFYTSFYKDVRIESIGGSGYRLQPCPMCGHSDCATVGEAVNCFSGSCGWKGTHISAWEEYALHQLGLTLRDAINRLDIYTGLKFPYSEGNNSKNIEDYEEERIRQGILRVCEDFYHDQLMECDNKYIYNSELITPKEYLLRIRKRKEETIKEFKIGFSINFLELHRILLSSGYTKEQIKKSKAWIPEGLFVFYYKNPVTKEIERINTKNPFNSRMEDIVDGKRIPGNIIPGYSVGQKILLTTPKFSYKKPIVVTEGEHDVFAIYENGADNAACIGGNMSDEQIINAFIRAENIIYTMFDNDEAGEVYRTRLNALLPQKDIRKIDYPECYKDPDDYYKSSSPSNIKLLFETATQLVTEDFTISHDKNTWVIENRHKKLEFIIDLHGADRGVIVGTANLYVGGVLTDREVDKDLTKCKANKKPFNFYLHDKINEHFNSGIDQKSAEELTDIYWYSARKNDIVRRLAKLLFESQNNEKFVNMLKIKLKTADGREDVIDAILKEANDIQNKLVGSSVCNIPKIKISQYFNVENNDAYFYFMNYKQDGDSLRRLPFLLRNDKTLIRLDLLKRKDSQCLLLVDNKYELPVEVSEAIMDPDECSLVQDVVNQYLDGKIDPMELDPRILIDVLTGYFRRFYYSNEDSIYKILSLYTMLTYYYELFDSIPYLYLNGQKGSGKSVIGSALHLFCFNAKMATDISDASLFRMTSLEGGTLILDEMEQLTSRKKGSESTMGIVLKGGYKRASNVYRADVETTLKTNRYDSYGPKVIINIMGLDDIIKDRCIQISTFKYKLTKENRREDPKSYLNKLGGIRSITSKLCLSALENFKKVNEIKNHCFFETNDYKARLSEILTPLLVIAKFVDEKECAEMIQRNPDLTPENCIGSYEKAVQDFYVNVIKGEKEDTERGTPEGILTTCIPRIARELYGLIPDSDKMYTLPEVHKYTSPIPFNKEEGWFELDLIHLKCFLEEHMPGEAIHTKIVSRWIKTCYNIDYSDIGRTVALIENEELIKEFKGNTRPKILKYRFYFRDFIDSIGSDFLENKASIETNREKPVGKKNKLF